jgi:lysophospholipase L1-like esterase
MKLTPVFVAAVLSSMGFMAVDYGARFTRGATISAYGDSFTAGAYASDTAHVYVSRLAAYTGATVNNQAVSGTETAEAAKALLATQPVLRKAPVTVLSGFNDIGRWGTAAFPKIGANTRAMIAAAFLRDVVPASAAPRSLGRWIAPGASIGGKSVAVGGTAMYSDDAGAYLEFDIYGPTAVVGAFTQISTGTYADLNVSVDGGAPSVYQSLGLTNMPYPQVGYNALVLRNLGVGKHTIRVSAVQSGLHCVIDYVGTLVDPEHAAGMLVGGVPTRTNWTIDGNTINQAITDQASAIIASVVSEFPGYPVRFVPVNDFYNTGFASDGYHPDDTGHFLIYQAFRSRLNLTP